MKRNENERARLSSAGPSERTRGSGHELKCTTFHPNTRNTFLLWGGWSNIGAGCPERVKNLQERRYSKLSWTWSWTSCYS